MRKNLGLARDDSVGREVNGNGRGTVERSSGAQYRDSIGGHVTGFPQRLIAGRLVEESGDTLLVLQD